MSKVIYRDTIGSAHRESNRPLRDCKGIPTVLEKAISKRLGDEVFLTPIQCDAIDGGICDGNSHFIVSSPTNSGKTLVGLFRIFTDIINRKSRCVYVAPLKALAEEKRNELEELCQFIKAEGGPQIRVAITTGDYQLTQDFLGSPPPGDGEIVICTPERLEIMLRSKENLFWARAVSSFIIDEFHLLGDSHRGTTVEILTTRILTSCPWSRIIALSATMGGLTNVATWLESSGTEVTLLENGWRYPTLTREVVSIADKDIAAEEIAATVLKDPECSLLIFVGLKREAERIAIFLQKKFPKQSDGIGYLHAGLTLKQRSDCLSCLLDQRYRVVVATTALKMGIDAPVSHVLVRDTFLWGKNGRKVLTYADLLQMTGRAGRRDIPGTAVVLVEEGQESEITELFQSGTIEQLTPQLMKNTAQGQRPMPAPILGLLLSEVVMQGRSSLEHLTEHLRHTFWGSQIGSVDCQREVSELVRLKLVFKDAEQPEYFQPTKLGRTVSLSGLSPESGAVIAGFLRALIKLDAKHEKQKGRRFGYLRRLTDLDLLFIGCSSYECRDSWIGSPSKKAIADVQEYLETLPPDDKPIVNLWRDEDSDDYPTHRLLTTLKIPFEKTKPRNAQKVFYRVMRTAILLLQHAKGSPLASLAIKFNAALGELENNLKFTVLWVLSCISQICNGRRCYKFDFLMMRSLKLIECVAVGSELGELLTIKGIGRKTVNKILSEGITSTDVLSECSANDLKKLGIGEKQLRLITMYLNKYTR